MRNRIRHFSYKTGPINDRVRMSAFSGTYDSQLPQTTEGKVPKPQVKSGSKAVNANKDWNPREHRKITKELRGPHPGS